MRLFKKTQKYFISGVAISTAKGLEAVGPDGNKPEIRSEFTAVLTLGPLDNNVVNKVRSFLALELGKQEATQEITGIIINTISLVR